MIGEKMLLSLLTDMGETLIILLFRDPHLQLILKEMPKTMDRNLQYGIIIRCVLQPLGPTNIIRQSNPWALVVQGWGLNVPQ